MDTKIQLNPSPANCIRVRLRVRTRIQIRIQRLNPDSDSRQHWYHLTITHADNFKTIQSLAFLPYLDVTNFIYAKKFEEILADDYLSSFERIVLQLPGMLNLFFEKIWLFKENIYKIFFAI